jgi:ribonuclease D
MPVPLFDTQLAAAMVGIGAQVSHTNLVRELLGIAIRNNQTVSDWSRRPLTAAQLAYAAEDVAYLHKLRHKLEERLRDLGRWEWMREEQSRRVEEAATSSHVPDDECYRLVKEWGKLSGQKLAILRDLAAWREREARARNTARRQIISDQALVGLARLAPSKREDVRNVRYLPQGQVYRHIDALLPVIERAKKLGPEDWPKKPSPPKLDVPVGMVELFQALARSVAEAKSIAPALLATTGELQALVNNRDRLDHLDLPVLTGWRREVIGEQLLALLDGRMHLRIEDRERLVIDER